jgi:hypothetical protein
MNLLREINYYSNSSNDGEELALDNTDTDHSNAVSDGAVAETNTTPNRSSEVADGDRTGPTTSENHTHTNLSTQVNDSNQPAPTTFASRTLTDGSSSVSDTGLLTPGTSEEEDTTGAGSSESK